MWARGCGRWLCGNPSPTCRQQLPSGAQGTGMPGCLHRGTGYGNSIAVVPQGPRLGMCGDPWVRRQLVLELPGSPDLPQAQVVGPEGARQPCHSSAPPSQNPGTGVCGWVGAWLCPGTEVQLTGQRFPGSPLEPFIIWESYWQTSKFSSTKNVFRGRLQTTVSSAIFDPSCVRVNAIRSWGFVTV